MCLYVSEDVTAIHPKIYKTYLVGYKKFKVKRKILHPYYQDGRYVIGEEITDGLPVYPCNQVQTIADTSSPTPVSGCMGYHIYLSFMSLTRNIAEITIPVLIPPDKIQTFGSCTCVAEIFVIPTPRISGKILRLDTLSIYHYDYDEIYYTTLQESIIINHRNKKYKPTFKYKPDIDMPEFNNREEAISYIHNMKRIPR